MVPFWQLTLFSLQRKKRKQQQDSDTFNFVFTAIIASSLAEIVGLFDTCYIDGWYQGTYTFPNHVPRHGRNVWLSFSCVCLLRWKCHEHYCWLVPFRHDSLWWEPATCLTWVSTLEILATEIRSTGHHAAANAISRVGGAIICPFIVSERTPLLAIGCIMLFVALVTACFVHKLPETMGQGMGVHCGDCRGKSTRTLLLLLLHHHHYLIAMPLQNCQLWQWHQHKYLQEKYYN
jgi:hypothetical protein